MRKMSQAGATLATILVLIGSASAQTAVPGTEEFGLTERELVQAVEKVEASDRPVHARTGFRVRRR